MSLKTAINNRTGIRATAFDSRVNSLLKLSVEMEILKFKHVKSSWTPIFSLPPSNSESWTGSLVAILIKDKDMLAMSFEEFAPFLIL